MLIHLAAPLMWSGFIVTGCFCALFLHLVEQINVLLGYTNKHCFKVAFALLFFTLPQTAKVYNGALNKILKSYFHKVVQFFLEM